MIGIMSDSHDNIYAIKQAVDFFNSNNVSLVLHTGDIISPFTVKELRNLKCGLRCVFGNNDGERKILYEKLSSIGAQISDIMQFEYDGLKFCMYHGTYEEIVQALIESNRYDVVVRGHTHKSIVEGRGKTLLINPGEICGYLTGEKTVALLDTEKISAEIYEL